MAIQLQSANAIGVNLRHMEDVVNYVKKLKEIEPEALDVVGIVESDEKGKITNSWVATDLAKILR